MVSRKNISPIHTVSHHFPFHSLHIFTHIPSYICAQVTAIHPANHIAILQSVLTAAIIWKPVIDFVHPARLGTCVKLIQIGNPFNVGAVVARRIFILHVYFIGFANTLQHIKDCFAFRKRNCCGRQNPPVRRHQIFLSGSHKSSCLTRAAQEIEMVQLFSSCWLGACSGTAAALPLRCCACCFFIICIRFSCCLFPIFGIGCRLGSCLGFCILLNSS